ncbi:hypothetical protein AB7783_07800 [Tardiphaga sp. 172_B4_N1_3]|jgi:hypothetical protein|uniref:hypothetical protein n=1 Tax=Tardiphaga sp. 172_B4_N1_3 TaxID=3240787 RepID=UPI003F8C5F14
MKSKKLLGVFWGTVAAGAPVILQGGLKIWSGPIIWLAGDHAFFLADLKQLIMHQGFWSSSVTGFPFGQVNAYFPTFEPLLRLLMLAIVSFGFDVFTAAKVFYIIGIGALGASAYACLRFLKIIPPLAALGGIVFAVSPYFQVRATNHDMLAIYVSAAFGAALAIHIAMMDRQSEFFALVRKPFFIAGILIACTGGFYYAVFSMLMVGVALTGLTVRTCQFRALGAFAVMCAIIVAAMLAIALGPNFSLALSGAPKRGPVEQFWHGLSISDALYTLDWFSWGREHIGKYDITRPVTLVGEGHHEWPGIILSVSMLVSPIVVLAFAGHTPSDRRWKGIVCASALMCFGLIFASRGGLGYLFNQIISPSLRGQSRIMPLLMFMAIFATLSLIEWFWQRHLLVTRGTAVLLVLGLLAGSWHVRSTLSSRQGWMADPNTKALIASVKNMLAAKDRAESTAILQLPVTNWPEAAFRPDYDFYPMRYGFLFDRADSPTKWSYGLSDRQDAFRVLSNSFAVGAADVVSRARGLGYDAILVEKLGYDAKDLSIVVASIESGLSPSCKIFDDRMRALYDIGNPCHRSLPPVQ